MTRLQLLQQEGRGSVHTRQVSLPSGPCRPEAPGLENQSSTQLGLELALRARGCHGTEQPGEIRRKSRGPGSRGDAASATPECAAAAGARTRSQLSPPRGSFRGRAALGAAGVTVGLGGLRPARRGSRGRALGEAPPTAPPPRRASRSRAAPTLSRVIAPPLFRAASPPRAASRPPSLARARPPARPLSARSAVRRRGSRTRRTRLAALPAAQCRPAEAAPSVPASETVGAARSAAPERRRRLW